MIRAEYWLKKRECSEINICEDMKKKILILSYRSIQIYKKHIKLSVN